MPRESGGTRRRDDRGQQVAYTTTTVDGPAGKPFTIAFQNEDQDPHNVDIKNGAGTEVFKGDIFAGVATKAESILVPAALTDVTKARLGLGGGLYPVPMLCMLLLTVLGAVHPAGTTRVSEPLFIPPAAAV